MSHLSTGDGSVYPCNESTFRASGRQVDIEELTQGPDEDEDDDDEVEVEDDDEEGHPEGWW